jgi:hypothetical protein
MIKKTVSFIFFLFLSFSLIAGDAITPLDRKAIKNMSQEQRQIRVNVLEKRLKEIQSMDLQSLGRSDKKEIKMEVKDINKELKRHAISGGVYISVGALIIIILLLIILL